MAIKTNPKKEAIRLTKLWQEHGPNTYPLDIEALIHGAIQTSDFSDTLEIERRHFDSLEGSLVRTIGQRKWTILLNTQVANARRQRFTFAHELGHFMCHRELREQFEDSDQSLNDFQDKIETEANEFSSVQWETNTLQEIGNRFECSLQASALRFVRLSSQPIAFVVSRDGIVLWATKSDSAPYMASYSFGDELPVGSQAHHCHENSKISTRRQPVGPVWNNCRNAFESQYIDQSGQGYQYTCIEFQ
jgi:hypothetical protein